MPRIQFTVDPKLPRDWQNLPFVKGYVANLSDDQAQRWVNRGVAVYVGGEPAPVPVEIIDQRTDKTVPIEIVDAIVPTVVEPADTSGFDPLTANEDTLRAYLFANGVRPHHKAGEAKLREMALDIATKP